MASLRFNDLGIDGASADNATTRYITFTTDGPGTVTTRLAKVSAGDVRICLWEGDQTTITGQQCLDTHRGGPSRVITDAVQHTWTVSLIGAPGSPSPIATLALSFNTDHPAIKIDGFRFQGVDNPGYNGVDVQVNAASGGRFLVKAAWTGGDQAYRLRLDDVTAGQNVDDVTGAGPSTRYDTELASASTYELTLSNEVGVAEQLSLVSATIRWP